MFSLCRAHDKRIKQKSRYFCGDRIQLGYRWCLTNYSWPIHEWDFNIDENVFAELEDGYEIRYMPLETHFGMWYVLNEYREDINHTEGMQKYLYYCVKHDKKTAPSPYVTWSTTKNRQYGYEIGHYFKSKNDAFDDFESRCNALYKATLERNRNILFPKKEQSHER